MFRCMKRTGEWALADVFAVVSDAVADRDAIVWGDRRETYAQTRSRTNALAVV